MFNGNYIEYQSKGDKDKNLLLEEYFELNIHKTLKNLRDHSSNKTQLGEWKIQLTMSINFISSKDSDEIHNMHAKSNNI